MFYEAVRTAAQLDVIEFGLPAEDPYLDGALIGAAHRMVVGERGLEAETALALIGGLKGIVQPRFVMTYAKEGRDLRGFFRLCVEHNIDGVLAPDLPLAEAREISAVAASLQLAYVSFVHSDMKEDEIMERASHSDIVYVKVSEGATGAYANMGAGCERLKNMISLVKKQNPKVLAAAGVGIQDATQVTACAGLDVDMIIVGTVLMECMNQSAAALSECIDSLRRATFSSKTRGGSVFSEFVS
jgi:tryptophan synthase alpha subunit